MAARAVRLFAVPVAFTRNVVAVFSGFSSPDILDVFNGLQVGRINATSITAKMINGICGPWWDHTVCIFINPTMGADHSTIGLKQPVTFLIAESGPEPTPTHWFRTNLSHKTINIYHVSLSQKYHAESMLSFCIDECVTKLPTPLQRIVLRDLLTHGFCTYERLIDQLWGQNPDGGPIDAKNNLRVHVQALRDKLIPSLGIDNEWGKGYTLSEIGK